MLIQLNTAGGPRRDYVVVPRRVRRFGRDFFSYRPRQRGWPELDEAMGRVAASADG